MGHSLLLETGKASELSEAGVSTKTFAEWINARPENGDCLPNTRYHRCRALAQPGPGALLDL